MRKKLEKMLEQSNDVHVPILIDETETAEFRLEKKPVIKSRLLCDMESIENFETVTEFAKIELTKEICYSGEHSLKFSCPTNRDNWDGADPGRIYAIPQAYFKVDSENWEEYNRISVWIYPDCRGIKNPTLRIQLHNDGEHKVPDIHFREGGHNFSMKPNCFNHIVLEIPYVARDKVVGISFDYDMLGHEPDAVDHATFYIDNLCLQEVDCDVYEGYIPAKDKIAFSNSGYQLGGEKLAIACGIDATEFKIIETKTGKTVLQKPIDNLASKVGDLQVLNFSEIVTEGEYIIICGNLNTRVFAISDDVWENSVWKVINFFLAQRCGYEVYLKHRACHSDMLLVHGDKKIVANGGWHDAGDLAQGFNNTAEATQAFFALAKAIKGKNTRLFRRVMEEAKWGLDYVIKTRFGDGYRASYSSCSVWTDGVIGTNDDVISTPTKSAYANLNAAYALALGAKEFLNLDEDYSRYALKIAKEDFAFGEEILAELNAGNAVNDGKEVTGADETFCRADTLDVQINSIAGLAAAEIFELSKQDAYKTQAIIHAKVVANCQQREYTDFDIPMVGFFYENVDHKLIWHHNHMSYAYLPDMLFNSLCEKFADEKDYMLWYSALYLSGIYYKTIAQFTNPYNVIPAGIYYENEAKEHLDLLLPNHPILEGTKKDHADEILSGYDKIVQKGFALGKGYYLRVYPVWFSFKGNYNVLLSDGLAASKVAKTLNDYSLYNIAQNQFEWIVGKNPMARSTMFGEGYDYCQLYAVQPGQTVGALSVGMESNGINDEPFWPQVNNATYKEVWVCSSCKWIWGMADNLIPSKISGVLKVQKGEPIIFQRENASYPAVVNELTGYFEIVLPCGEYIVKYGEDKKPLTVISGKEYQINGELYTLKADVKKQKNSVKIKLKLFGEHDLKIDFKYDNLTDVTVIDKISPNGEAIITAKIVNENAPIVGIVIPNNNLDDGILIA